MDKVFQVIEEDGRVLDRRNAKGFRRGAMRNVPIPHKGQHRGQQGFMGVHVQCVPTRVAEQPIIWAERVGTVGHLTCRASVDDS